MIILKKAFGMDIKLLRRLTTNLARTLLSLNMDEEEAVTAATAMINDARHMMADSRRHEPSDYAKKLIQGKGFRNAGKIREWLKNEGVNDEDILWWNGLPELERWVNIRFDEWQMERARKKLILANKPEDEVEKSILKLFPRFEFIEEMGESDFPDRALPHQLRRRVERWIRLRRTEGITDYWAMTQNYSSLNALIRYQIMQRIM
jgi:hypothetical protein